MGLSLTIEIDDRTLPALDALASRRSTSREAVLAEALDDYLGLAAGDFGNENASTLEESTINRSASGRPDPYLAYLDEFLSEWNSPEDADAFDHL